VREGLNEKRTRDLIVITIITIIINSITIIIIEDGLALIQVIRIHVVETRPPSSTQATDAVAVPAAREP
jgi:hypothetical protein